MRIALDIRPMLETRRSGVANYTARLLRALLARPAPPGRSYVLFGNAFGRELPDDLPAPGRGVEHRFSRYPNRLLNAAMAFAGRPRIEDLTGGADAVYLPNLNFAATERPLVVTVHDLSFERYPRFFSAKQRLWHGLVRPRRLLRRAAFTVAVSRHTKADLVETYGVDPERVAVITPAAGPEFAPAGPGEIGRVRARYGLPREFFLYLGTLEPRKNVGGLIAAFEKIGGSAGLVIAGGQGWLYREIFDRAKRSPAADRIKFLDYVDAADQPALYSAAAALVYPSFYEGFGMPPLEAMACGTPVVASQAASLGEVVGDAGLLVDPYDSAEIADAMKAVLEEPGLARTLRARGLARAALFSWTKSAERLDGLFRRLEGEK